MSKEFSGQLAEIHTAPGEVANFALSEFSYDNMHIILSRVGFALSKLDVYLVSYF